MKSKKDITLLWIMFIAIGLGVSIVPVKEYVKSGQSKTWPFVEGIITASSIMTKPYGKSFGYPKHTYTAKVKYSYIVKDTKYIGDKIRFGWIETDDRESATTLINKYSIGGITDVYYNPREPSESVLEPLLNSSLNLALKRPLMMIVTGPGFILVGVFILICRNKLIE